MKPPHESPPADFSQDIDAPAGAYGDADASAPALAPLPPPPKPRPDGEVLSGAQILVRVLQREGIPYVWGYPGGAVLQIYDALFEQTDVQHVLVRHEQGAVHAADGYARATGEVGVALVTSGPGVTNAITGIATAFTDSIPLVVITGQVPTHAIGMDAFQECDAVGITRPIVKHNFLVKDVRDLAPTLKKAFYIAREGRPGPVVVDVPKDVSQKTAVFSYPDHADMRHHAPPKRVSSNQVRKAVQLLRSAERPYVYAGGGVVLGNAAPELRAVCEALGAPVTNTLLGLGATPASDPKFLGMLGMHGTYEANMAMQHCDVLLAVGARFDDRVIGNPRHFASRERKIIHIDIDASSISKRVKVDVPIVGDAREVLAELLAQWREGGPGPDLKPWWEEVNGWRARQCLNFANNDGRIKPQYVVQTLARLLKGRDHYITSDVGQHQMWAAQYFPFEEPRRWINSGGLGTMGVGLPYAMGIKLARPDSEVVCITGEGSIQMCIQELSTCLQYDTPVKIVALNNGYLGMVRQWQQLDYQSRYSHSYMDALPDFVKLAEAYGHIGIRVTQPSEVEPALKEMLALKDRTVFLDVRTDPGENVWPMVQAGKGISEMRFGTDEQNKGAQA
ncbi:MAG: acetolactate synthase 3 catalytic subunit [Proteobacteria bacterium]|nr:acetolactate synthase 3 catalytic subunit [Pseudomonadota bacterium]